MIIFINFSYEMEHEQVLYHLFGTKTWFKCSKIDELEKAEQLFEVIFLEYIINMKLWIMPFLCNLQIESSQETYFEMPELIWSNFIEFCSI